MKRLPNGGGEMLEEPEHFGPRTFTAEMTKRFPALRNAPDVDIGVHIAMAALAGLTMDAVANRDLATIGRVFEFLDSSLAQPRLHPEIPNAVAISFVQPSQLQATEFGRRVWEFIPPAIRELV